MLDAADPGSRIEVTHFQRRPAPGQHSMEMLAEDIREAMPSDIDTSVHTNRFQRGILRRLWNIIAAWWFRGDVNHVIGDVHYLGLLLPRNRTIITIHDCGSLDRLRGLRRWLFWLFWFHLPLRRAARVTVVSEFTRHQLLQWVDVPAELVSVIPTPISNLFEKWTYPPEDERPRILQVGTRPNKNLKRVIEAVSELEVELVIIGRLTDGQREMLGKHAIQFENHIDLSRQQMVEQYRRAHAVVFASTYEGFGMPIVEAQATGRPVVTSDRSPMIETSGGAACLVDPYDVDHIREGIERVLKDSSFSSKLVRLGYENASKYNPRRVAEAYARIYRAIAS